jgi:hypothetical protein
LEGGGGDLMRRIGRQREHSKFSVFFVVLALFL